MKKSIFTFIFLLLLSSHVLAKNAFCDQLHDLSFKIMIMRQQNVSIAEQMETIDKMGEINQKNKPFHDLLRKVVVSAYEEPRYEVEENKKNAALDFANDWSTPCYKNSK